MIWQNNNLNISISALHEAEDATKKDNTTFEAPESENDHDDEYELLDGTADDGSDTTGDDTDDENFDLGEDTATDDTATGDTTDDTATDDTATGDTTDDTATDDTATDDTDDTATGDTTDDTATDDDTTDDENFDLADDATADDGSDTTSDDATADDAGMGAEQSDPRQKLKELENSIFDQLSNDEKESKSKALKKLYTQLYYNCKEIVESINDMTKRPDDIKIYEYIVNNLQDLMEYILDYINDTFDNRTYMENSAEFEKYLSVLDAVKKVLEEVKKAAEKQ